MQDMREHALPLLEAAGVDLVLSGHSHMYERSYLIDCHYDTSDSFGQSNIVSDGINHRNVDYHQARRQATAFRHGLRRRRFIFKSRPGARSTIPHCR